MKSRISIDFLETDNGLEPCIKVEYNESADAKDKLVSSLLKSEINYLEVHKGYQFNDTENIITLIRETNWTKLRLRVSEIYNSYIENSEFDLTQLGMGMCGDYFYFGYDSELETIPNYLYTDTLIDLNILQLVSIVLGAIEKELEGKVLEPKKEINPGLILCSKVTNGNIK